MLCEFKDADCHSEATGEERPQLESGQSFIRAAQSLQFPASALAEMQEAIAEDAEVIEWNERDYPPGWSNPLHSHPNTQDAHQ